MSDSVISVQGVSKDFKISHERGATLKSHFVSLLKGQKQRNIETQHALKNVSFDIKAGEFFGIVGRNGSGKSTLLKMIAGIYQPTKGSIRVEGKLVPFIELGVGFNPELTGRENVFLNGALLGFSEDEVIGFYDEVVEFAELNAFMDKKLKNYSSGMQVRLAFAMAVRAKADILLIDEVLAVGDADFQQKCFSYFKLLKKQKCTVVFVSHDMGSVREYCDRAILVEDGEIKASGKTNKVADEYTKLFMNTRRVGLGAKSVNRQGGGEVTISNIKKILTIKSKEDKPVIDFKITANKSVEGIIVGIKCKNAADEPIFGTNTVLENKTIKKLSTGESRQVKLHIPNIFNNGEYNFDLVVQNDEGVIFDWIVDAIRIDVRTERRTGYIIEIPIKVEVTSGK